MCDRFYALCEKYGSKLSCWAWHKRWSNRADGTGYKKKKMKFPDWG